ncbi:MAG: hypothetical protein A2091_05095 [Desulfuromonadales bacterium GWD2_61_12]|nr:MAG: hypothetical protein A2005_08890 [Desulfuromonadales bacterium GWC2_61_20]OGR33760.1 MAG: hypothetical protein A2091_05095 [Desulfuromonadales bacterium GWD2_61_12]
MKAVIINCLESMVKEGHGLSQWEATLEVAGLPANTRYLPSQDIDDRVAMKIFAATCTTLKISKRQAAEAFGDYWVNTFCQKIYKPYFRGATSARELLLKMDQIHENVTQNIAHAAPPRFGYTWKDDKTLLMQYRSTRGMIDYLIGLVQGVGRYFREDLKIRKLSESELEIVFPA